MRRRPDHLSALLGTLVGLSVLVGCAAESDPRMPDAVRSDSAGVEIVLDSLPASSVPVFGTLDSLLDLRLGSIDGRPEEQFGAIGDLSPHPDGGVWVLDRQAAEIRFFDAEGAFQMSVGSRGDGPGEFQNPIEISLLSHDTIAVYDAGPRRVTRFGPDGAAGRMIDLEDTRGRISRASFFADGRLVGQSHWIAPDVGSSIPGPEPTLVRDTAVLTVFRTDGMVEDTVDLVPGLEELVSVRVSERSVSVLKRPPAFGRTNLFAVHPEGVWSANNDRFELRLRSTAGGRLLRIVRAPGLEQPITDELETAIHERALAEVETPEDRRRMETWIALSPRPATQPAYDRLVVDDRGRLWTRAWATRAPADRWWVFSAAGDLLGSVDAPGGLEIMSVTCDRVWGVERDELDISYVVRYALSGPDIC